ncbi:MAG: ABC transporter substrate-binding protein [Hyphomicrobiaceae bacterium]|nr:ABC transporter substrate-binding protein [Hyphomicrobiaceae bacterium]
MLNRRDLLVSSASAALISAAGSPAFGQSSVEDVKIGVIYPFTGSGAQVGVDARFALDTAADIINEAHDIDLPLAKGKGLSNLGGAKVRLVYADHQADPQKGRSEAERLVTQDSVAALLGTYYSSVAAVVSQVAERYQLPFVAAESSSPSLHVKGLKYFFRPGPHDEMYSIAMFDFIKHVQQKFPGTGATVALFYEDTLFGNDTSKVQKRLAEEQKVEVVADIKYRANSPSLSSEVQLLKSKNPDIILATSYTTDAILFVRTMRELGFKPKGIISQNGGFIEPAFLSAVGEHANGIISRASFVLDLATKRPSLKAVNDLFKKRSGKDLNDNTAREFMALIILADAINRAKSIKGPDIEAALRATDMPGASTIMPWDRVKFGADGQNSSIKPVMMQYGDGEYRTVWPEALATRPLKWPLT